MEGSWYPWYSDGTRNPLFPWVAATFLDAQEPDFFEKGKRLNVLLAICGTAAVAVFFSRRLGPLPAFNATALSSLAALLPISTFFGAEAIFLVLFLFVFASGMRLLNENPLRLYLLLGLLTALAWLAKSSTTPLLVLFVTLSVVRYALNLKFSESLPWHLRAPAWGTSRFLTGLAIFLSLYFALISPRLIHAHQTWGNAFYSLPSFWFWADDWETCVRKYADCRKVRLAELPIEEQPTWQGYFHRHDLSDAFSRLTKGAAVRLGQLFHPEGKWRLNVERKDKPKRIVLPHRGLYLLGLKPACTCDGDHRRHSRTIVRGRTRWASCPAWPGHSCGLCHGNGMVSANGPWPSFHHDPVYAAALDARARRDQLRLATGSRFANLLYLAGHLAICVFLVSRIVALLQNTQFEKISYAF